MARAYDVSCGHRSPHERHSHSSNASPLAAGALPSRSWKTYSEASPDLEGTTEPDPHRGQARVAVSDSRLREVSVAAHRRLIGAVWMARTYVLTRERTGTSNLASKPPAMGTYPPTIGKRRA